MTSGYPYRSRDWPVYALATLPVLGGLLLLAAELPARLLHGAWLPVRSADWLTVTAGILRNPARPAAAWPAATRSLAPGPVEYYSTLLLLLVVVAAAAAAMRQLRGDAGVPHVRRPRHRRGFAERGEVRDALGGRRAATVAQVSAQARAGRAATEGAGETGVHLGRDRSTGNTLWGTWEDSYGILGAPRQGKGLGFLVKVLATWPGPLVAPSTKPDNLLHTALVEPRVDRPLYVLDPSGLSGWRPSVRWSPVAGCEDPEAASLRAEAFVFAAPEDPSVKGGRFWKDSAAGVLRCYLHAAALAGADMHTVQRWARRHECEEPASLLRRSAAGAADGWADDLEATARLPIETRASVFGQLATSLGFLSSPLVMEACCPEQGVPVLDVDRFLDERGRLYLLGTAAGQRGMAPLITALVETVADAARRRAAVSPGGRLSPPLGLFIDEAAQIAPLPTLPSLLADGGGQGITTFVVLQSLGQARERWGEHAATALWDACTAKLIFGGLTSARDLEAIARVCPEIDDPVVSRSHGQFGNWSDSTSVRRVPALTPADVRELPRWRALLLYPGLRPVETAQLPWWEDRRYSPVIGPAREAMRGRLLV